MAAKAAESLNGSTAPIAQIDLSDASIFQRNQHWPIFERLRRENPVHFCAHSPCGPYWSVTRYQNIMEVDSNHHAFSSAGATSLDETRAKGKKADSTQVGGFLGMRHVPY